MLDILEWDSDFFKIKVAKATKVLEVNNLKELEEEFNRLHIDLAYYYSKKPLELPELPNSHLHFLLADIKITFGKKIEPKDNLMFPVKPYPDTFPDPQLEKLSIASGIYSRFNTDHKIGKENFENLYKEWIANSVNKKIALEVLTYNEGGKVAGFVTLGEKNLKADIGIIAVDEDFRGKGIGKALMFCAEEWFAKNSNFKEIQVVTQENNLPASKLYNSCGYKIINKEYVYHIWKGK